MATVAQLTKDGLREMIETAVEQKLLEFLGDPDEGLLLQQATHDRLCAKGKQAGGERGEPFGDVIRPLGLE